MKKLRKIILIVLTITFLSTIMGMDKVNAETGTTTDGSVQEIPEGYTPIYNIDDLYAIRNNTAGNYILMNDIDMTEATSEGGEWDQGNGWTPIEIYYGIFDGNGHRISGMNIYGTVSTDYVGLFGQISGGTIKNLGLADVNIDVKSLFTGGIVGYSSSNSTISSCYCSGKINNSYNKEKSSYTGGICGFIGMSSIDNCMNLSEISANNSYSSYATAIVGGIVSAANSSSLYKSYIEKCYDIGSVTGTSAYAICTAATNTTDSNRVTYDYNYYLKGSAELGIPFERAGSCVGLTQMQMKNTSVYTGFDFDNIWTIDKYCSYSYPQLKNNRILRVSNIKITAKPSKLSYNQGETLELSDSVIEICYEDEVTTSIPITTDMVSGFDMNEIGVQTVTVTYGGKTTSFDIEVKEIPVTSISIPKTLSIYRSKTYQFEPEILPLNATDKTVTWESDDTSIVSVDNAGLLKAKSKGTTKIRVTTANNLTQECEVTVLVASAQVTLNQTAVTLKPGESATLTAQIAPLESTDTITWESDNTQVAEVTEGVVVAKNEGVATISAYTESGVKATCTVSVKIDNSAEIKVVKGTKAKIKSISNVKGKKIKLKLSGRSSCTGYQIQYGTKSNFKGAKSIKKNSNAVTLSKLKTGKKYYIRARVYEKMGKKYYYGKWSSKKTVMVKK